MCEVYVGSKNRLPPHSERTLFSVIESLLERAHRSWTTELVVAFDGEDVVKLAIRARQESVEQKLTCRPKQNDGTYFDPEVHENLLTLVVINAAKNLRPNLEKHLREQDCGEAGYEDGMFRIAITLPEVQRVPAEHLVRRSQ